MTRKSFLLSIVVALLLCYSSCFLVVGGGVSDNTSVKPISDWLLSPWEYIRVLWDSLFENKDATAIGCEDFVRYHPVHTSGPIAHVAIPQHPSMGPN
jgi:hypothetical protein